MTKIVRNEASRRRTSWRGAASAPNGMLDAQLCFALYAASRASTAVYRTPLAELGLTYPRYLVMVVLWEKDDVPISILGERLFLDFGTLSPLLKRLEADKLIVRVRDKTDERVVRAVLTERGRRLRRSVEKMQANLACLLDLAPSQVARLRKHLWMLLQDLMKAGSSLEEAHTFEHNSQRRRPRGTRALGGRGSARLSRFLDEVGRSRHGWRQA